MKTYVETSTNKWEMQEGHILDTEITRKKFNNVLNEKSYGTIKRVFEIGFNGGHSARMWLDLGAEHVHSVDICEHPYVEEIARELEEQDSRFTFQKIDSNDLVGEDLKGYDLLFVDGDHSEEGVRNDVFLGEEAEIPFILIDDYNHREDKWNGRIGACVDSIVGDIFFKYAWFGSTLHYDATGGTNKMRLMIRNSHWKNLPVEMQEYFTKQ